MPRQGTGKRSQAGNWQAFPGRELASVPGRDCKHAQAGMHTGKRSQAGNWQASQAGTANVPRQGTGKCSQAGNRRRPQAGDSGCSHAGNCRHCKSLATICHQPRGATPPPTSRVLCDELACLLTGRGAIVNYLFSIFLCYSFLSARNTVACNIHVYQITEMLPLQFWLPFSVVECNDHYDNHHQEDNHPSNHSNDHLCTWVQKAQNGQKKRLS